MCVEVTGVPQWRVGLAPTVSLKIPPCAGQAAMGIGWCLVPWVAIIGSHFRPVVMTACNCRKMAAAMTAWAWVGVSLLFSRLVRYA